MTTSYFLGSNSSTGFFSLYDTLSDADVYLHILKGGPGTGKSGFMRRLGRAAQERGFDVEYVLCSGDPDSLDAVYIPSLRLAFADGTAPHVLEPRRFGVDSDYVNLGQFLELPYSPSTIDYVNHLYDSYKEEYRRAYCALASAGALLDAQRPPSLPEAALLRMEKRLAGILGRNAGHGCGGAGSVRKLFLNAICCQGELRLESEINILCKQCYVIDNAFGQADGALRCILRWARAQGMSAIAAADPLRPSRLTAVLLPQAQLAFADDGWKLASARHLRFDRLLPAERQTALKAERKRFFTPYRASMALALESLSRAKRLHDELESVYVANMDFAALDGFTSQYIETIFGR